MDKFIFTYNLITALTLICIGLVFIIIRTIPHSFSHPYRIAKRYMGASLIFGGLTIINAMTVGKLSNGKIEVLNIFSLLNILVGFTLLLCSLITLYNFKHLVRHKLIPAFVPTLFFIAAYGLSLLLWQEPKAYSVDEYITQASSSPVILLKLFTLIAMLWGVALMVIQSFKSRSKYLTVLERHYAEKSRDKIKWIDQVFSLTGLAGIIAILSNIITWTYIDFIYSLILVCGSIFTLITFIIHQKDYLETTKKTLLINDDETPDNRKATRQTRP